MKYERTIFGELVRSHLQEGIIVKETRFPPNLYIPLHTHDDHAYFNLVLCGGYREFARNHAYLCGPLGLVFHASGATHSNQFFEGETTRLFTIRLDMSLVEKGPGEEEKLSASTYIEGGALRELALKLYRESQESDSISSLVIEEVALQMMAEVSHSISDAELPKRPAWLTAVADLLHSQFNQSLTLAELALEIGVQKFYLARAFNQHFKCTIGEYLRFLRIEHACQKLSRSDASVLDVCFDCGFASQSHFSRTFTRLTGLTPVKYKAMFGT